MRHCPNCGKLINGKTLFCPHCGANLAKFKAPSSHKTSNGGLFHKVLKPKSGQQTLGSFYSKHRIMIFIVGIIIIVLALAGGLKAHHDYEYPTDKLPPAIANRTYTFKNAGTGTQLQLHSTNFTFMYKGSDIDAKTSQTNVGLNYQVTSVHYSKPFTYINMEYTGSNDPEDANNNVHYGQLELKIQGHRIMSYSMLKPTNHPQNN